MEWDLINQRKGAEKWKFIELNKVEKDKGYAVIYKYVNDRVKSCSFYFYAVVVLFTTSSSGYEY